MIFKSRLLYKGCRRVVDFVSPLIVIPNKPPRLSPYSLAVLSRRPCEPFVALIVRPSLSKKAEYFIFERLLFLHKAYKNILVRERLFGKMRIDLVADLQCASLPVRLPLILF